AGFVCGLAAPRAFVCFPPTCAAVFLSGSVPPPATSRGRKRAGHTFEWRRLRPMLRSPSPRDSLSLCVFDRVGGFCHLSRFSMPARYGIYAGISQMAPPVLSNGSDFLDCWKAGTEVGSALGVL